MSPGPGVLESHGSRRYLRRVAPRLLGLAILVGLAFGLVAAQAPPARPSVAVGREGRLAYVTDDRGNRIVDFSHAGYGGGGRAIPDAPARIVVGPEGGLHRERIQAAIDLVSALPRDPNGLRGAVLLEPGTYRIDSSLIIAASGVVLRGSGRGPDGTVLLAAGTSRRALIVVSGRGERTEVAGSRRRITDDYVPAGATSFTVDDATALSPGERVVVQRPSTAEWIARLGMDRFPGWRPENRLHWQPGSRDVRWDRTVTAIDGRRITIDAPLTTALERDLGGGTLARYDFPGRVRQVGVENLRCVSEYDTAHPMDENHAWFAVSLDKLEDAWVRQVTAVHFVSSLVTAETDTRAVTVEDCESLDPVSEVGGYRRRAFFTAGELTLVQRCRSERGRHDFGVGITAAGPNVFLEASSRESLDFSGPLESWASGVLYDNVTIRGNALRLTTRGMANQGAGWAAANSVLWNCEATDVEAQSPPGAANRAYGCKGLSNGDGIVDDPRAVPYRDFFRGIPAQPRSLYLAQLEERLGRAAVEAIQPREVPTASAGARPLSDEEVAAIVARALAADRGPTKPLTRDHGAFVIDGQPAWTGRTGWSWFQAQMIRSLALKSGPAITRFAPGRVGPGLTDDLDAVADGMAPRSVFYHHYGLWYDRRRVDHNYYGSQEQRTGDVWAPFVELPWARSGQGKAWDGLSKYDLTRFNAWFFERLKAFADLCDRRGLVLYHNFYFQHWLTESRAHYVDFPWRPANTIQQTGLPDEVPAANAFYDVGHPLRRELHRLYIRHALDALKGATNVVHGIDREYTGSVEFVQFWLDEIATWQREHGTRLLVSLEIPKDQMDAILEDPVRGPLVSAVDFHGWLYRADGRLFAIRGGLNRSPREQRPDIATPDELESLRVRLGAARLDSTDFLNSPDYQGLFDTLWAGSKPMRYRAWREYRDRYPDLVVLARGDEYPELTRSVERRIPAGARAGLRSVPLVRTNIDSAWCMARPGEAYLVYSMAGAPVDLDLRGDEQTYATSWLSADTASLAATPQPVRGGGTVTLAPPAGFAGRPWVAWLSRANRSGREAP